MHVNQIAKARKRVSRYCVEECKAYCCRKGYLELNREEMIVVTGGKPEEFAERLKKSGDVYTLYLGDGCPCLDEKFMCRIHSDEKRPRTCRHYPIFLYDDKIVLSSRCFAVKDNILYPYLKQMRGFSIEYR